MRKFLHPSESGGTQETYCIDIKKLPIALAKIEITPKMEESIQKLSERLEKYQEECADVLAEAFIGKQGKLIVPKDYPAALRAYADEYEKRMLIEEKNKELSTENQLLTQETLEWADRPLINSLVRRYAHSIGNDFQKAWGDFKKELLYKYGININARKTAHLNNGGKKSKKMLDFISDEEIGSAVSTAVALCRNNKVDISDIIKKMAS